MPIGWPPSRTSRALFVSSRAAMPSTGSLWPTVAMGGPITEPTARSKPSRIVERVLEQLAVGDRAHHLGQRQRRLGLDHRHLGHAVLLEEGDGGPHGLFGVDVDQRREAVALGRQHRLGRGSLGPGEPVVGHPVVVVQLGEVAPARVGHQHDDHVVGPEVSPMWRAAQTAVPHEPPTIMPSSVVTRRAVRNESLSDTATTWSTVEGS